MELGNYLRSCRESSKRTQPDVAAEIAIEQSYLSKIESGKSTPSEDVFGKLQRVYGIDLDKMIALLDANELGKLKEIKSIQAALARGQNRRLTSTRKWLVVGWVMLMLGAGCLALTLIPDRSNEEFVYRSEGVLQPEEDLNAFDLVYDDKREVAMPPEQFKKRAALLVRLDQKDETTTRYRGDGYLLQSEQGRRFYKLVAKRLSSRSYANRWFFVPTLMFLTGGLGAIFIARRWN